ncbi:acetate kinase [candidate division TA06 bacterium]|uniref:Acetate kinase n=1 Tax=candidate division TA06 bacterium TaxID=2250710 RepID=A0A660S9D4_UNCT6|nr:MAG: acetate kinase [candidate division TA06 bacterium]
MNILVINSGSSSIKYQYFKKGETTPIIKGIIERVGMEGATLSHSKRGFDKYKKVIPVENHKKGIEIILNILGDKKYGALKSLDEINAVGHRVVHGGESFSGSVLIDDDVIKALEDCTDLAPLHNPPNLLGIYAMRELLPEIPNVAVFDTAFHSTIPKHAYIYAIPYKYYEKYKIRRYGFHGTSHDYVSVEGAKMLGTTRDKLKIVTCHLGNGSSIAAVDRGKSVDTSLGFGTMCGIPMGTRAGDIDPAIVPFLMEKERFSATEMRDLLYKKSGLLGISEISSDMRDIEEKAMEGDEKAILSLKIYAYYVKKYIGMYAAIMNGLDLVIFTAGVGENGWEMREMILSDMEFFGIKLDRAKNRFKGEQKIITTDDSKVKAAVVPTNEELMIAKDTQRIVKKMRGVDE